MAPSAAFTIDQVARALGISPAVITNHQHNNRLDLCSAAPGRGSSRLFCVLDVYMLALLRGILELTGDANRAARDVNRLVFSDSERVLPPSRRSARKKLLREDLGIAHEVFTYRPSDVTGLDHHSGDWFLIAEDVDEGFRPFRHVARGASYRDDEFSNILYHGAIVRRAGAFFNATLTLGLIDEQLSRITARGEL